ncbi:TlpA family protein disulfide reductase [Vibrio rotiferianus]|uniref:TlpA family protein disulfide reductase n=1 Tax=Vibrio rotiferianus TaxID=190895 RepID=UPI00039D37E7|nr:TlpA disulfide reductase family protein [Vibrio rotiferianus]PIB12581.1 cytochrome oxidase biogenesis protein Sco1/SenC/PrrC [Vibrio rotiferianus CAIM 577 = LMG 21460]
MNKWTSFALVSVTLCLSFSITAKECTTPEGFKLENAAYQLTELKSPVSLVNLWAVWCPPCLKELPALDSIANNEHFSVETVHIGDNLPAIEQRFSKLGIHHLPKTIEADMGAIHALGFQGLPATLVVINGETKFRYSGYIKHSPEVIQDWLTCLREEL